MLNKFLVITAVSLMSLIIVSCDRDSASEAKKVTKKKETEIVQNNSKRWYTSSQSMRGRQVFKDNCATCHGDKGQGLAEDWRKPLANDTYPAPPLNGTAHTWHHSKEALLRTINNGGIPLGGTMPQFKDSLTDKQKEEVLAYVMSLWPNNIYMAWKERNPS
ncbi:cytochrome c [uncultured Cocleimonas sp.]|uniref:c-type cytochrome n=1 Tax=uncultured Cocleimonas sp. TaxID=1051587 RepID=UPI00261DCCCE|nr:cytochrome c [uncultured Cocleimonas sp.]